MSKYGFDLEIMNIMASVEDVLAKLTDNFKSNEITYKNSIELKDYYFKKARGEEDEKS